MHALKLIRALPIWMRHRAGFRISSHLTCLEKVQLYRLAQSARGGAYVEIGSYIGASSYFLAAAASDQALAASVICVDTWNNDAMTAGRKDTYGAFLLNTRRHADAIFPIRGFSHEVVESVRQRAPDGIRLLFIDGDHSYEGVKRDWDCYSPLLASGAIVAFHDIGWAVGVKTVVEQDVLPCVVEFGRLPNLCWGTLRQ